MRKGGLPWVLDLTFHPSELVFIVGATAAESPRSQNLSQGYTFSAGEIRLDGNQ